MKLYRAFFLIHFKNAIQYKIAAYAGVIAQYTWAMMNILLYRAFYNSNSIIAPMDFKELVSYLWLQQAFFTLFATWYLDKDIINAISEGSIAYELCRPINLYNMWFSKNIANRFAKALIRSVCIIILGFLMPKPYRLTIPSNLMTFFWFCVSMILAAFIVVAFCMLIYIITFYTISPMGIRMIMSSIIEFLAGSVIPLPFFPNSIRKVIDYLPFASMQNIPFRIYSGNIIEEHVYFRVFIQVVWLVVLVWIGKAILNKALKKVVVQGG